MAQGPWNIPIVGNPRLPKVLKTLISNALQALLTRFSGADHPDYTVAYMQAVKTADGLLYTRDAANGAWVVAGPAVGNTSRRSICVPIGDTSTDIKRVAVSSMAPFRVERVSIVGETATTGSTGTDEWRFELRNETQALDLFSGTVGTGTALAQVGGGAELAALAAFNLVPDQNADLAIDDVLTLRVLPTGVPAQGTLTNLHAVVEGFPLG